VRLLRVQLDHVAGSVPARLTSIEARLALLEPSAHDQAAEAARGFGRVPQLLARQERRLDAVDAGLSSLREALAENTDRILDAIRGGAPA